MTAYIDTSELTRLAEEFGEHVTRVSAETRGIVDKVAEGVKSDASANANSYGGTGELGNAVRITKAGNAGFVDRRVGAAVRQAFFLEYGSPKTGAPRPWLTAPAAKGHALIADELAKIAKPL